MSNLSRPTFFSRRPAAERRWVGSFGPPGCINYFDIHAPSLLTDRPPSAHKDRQVFSSTDHYGPIGVSHYPNRQQGTFQLTSTRLNLLRNQRTLYKFKIWIYWTKVINLIYKTWIWSTNHEFDEQHMNLIYKIWNYEHMRSTNNEFDRQRWCFCNYTKINQRK